MQIEYRIVWIDDSPAWVDSIVPSIEEHLGSLDFVPVIERFDNGESIVANGIRDDVDLVALDYRLPGVNGDQIITSIRERENFTDVVFYSQEVDPNELLDEYGGIYRCPRSDVEDTMRQVITEATKKLSEISVYRGRILAEMIDLENEVDRILIELFGEYGALIRAKFIDKPVNLEFGKKVQLVQSMLKDVARQCNSLRGGGGENERMLSRVSALKAVLAGFFADIIDQRNMLAHVRPAKREDGVAYLRSINGSAKDIELTDAWRGGIRDAITKHRENLESIQLMVPELRSYLVGE